MTAEKSRRPVVVFATLAIATVAFGVQPAAAFAKPTLEAHQSTAWSGAQARRDGYAFSPAPPVGSFAAALWGAKKGVCDHGDNPMIC